MPIYRRQIDWVLTGRNLAALRMNNETLRRNVCSMLRQGTDKCKNAGGTCETCTPLTMDWSISRPELGRVFNITENVINNWENGRTPVGLEDMLYYCDIAGVTLDDILVFSE